MFTLRANQNLNIRDVHWQVVQHPGALGMAYGQEGRAAVVYQLCRANHYYQDSVLLLGSNSRTYEVPGDGTSVTLGRAPGNQIVLEAVAVSRQHGALVVKDGNLMVWDNSARNGTFVDGNKIEPQKWVLVPAGSRLQLGTAEDGEPLAVRPTPSACRALKVFKSRFRVPRLVELAAQLAAFADIQGLQVCTRTVFTPQDHKALLTEQPELIYGVLMPWIEGRSWMETIMERQPLSAAEALECAGSLAKILVQMEQRGIAHCDLSGPNVSLERNGQSIQIQLVDVEQIYAPGFPKPEEVFAGSPGYAHRQLDSLAWSPVSDRFSGAILLCEMLAWASPEMRELAWSESFFEPAEMQTQCTRSEQLRDYLSSQWGTKLSRLFERAWQSDSPDHCPTFGEWQLALPDRSPVSVTPAVAETPVAAVKVLPTKDLPVPTEALSQGAPTPPSAQPSPAPAPPRPQAETVSASESADGATALMDAARVKEEKGDIQGALANYRLAYAMAPQGSALAKEIGLIVNELSSHVASEPPPPVMPKVSISEGEPTRGTVDPELLKKVRALEGLPGLAPVEKRLQPPPKPRSKAQLFGYALVAVMSILLLAFLVHYKPWAHEW
ncbi:MAG: serine/threonine-protein kinase [Vulcanimicrobiota bacterium]